MAGDWIKMRTDLYRDPKVCTIAESMVRDERYHNVTRNVMRNVTVGALVTLWGVTRHRGKRDKDDLVLRGVPLSVVDDITELPGFGDALAIVGWVVQKGDALIFPRFFEEFNVEPAIDAKKKNAERQRRYREKSNALRNVTVTSRSDVEESREEKSRVETKTPLTPLGGGESEKQPTDPFSDYNTDGTNPPPASRAKATFDAFWELFPNKANEAGARREWKKLVERTSMPNSLLDMILAKVAIWRVVWIGRPENKRPAAVWWIQNERWNDPDPPAESKEETIEDRMKRIREANKGTNV